jgi:prolyl-tRNA synthetase
MGSYGIGSGRLMASVAEEHHDEYGLIWPMSIAPYAVHLIVLPSKSQGANKTPDLPNPVDLAEQLYQEFIAAGIEILFDDRHESPGVKFNDADLIGIPLRLTVSERALQSGGIEFKRRDQRDKRIIPLEHVLEEVQSVITELQSNIDQLVVKIPFED